MLASLKSRDDQQAREILVGEDSSQIPCHPPWRDMDRVFQVCQCRLGHLGANYNACRANFPASAAAVAIVVVVEGFDGARVVGGDEGCVDEF